MCGITAVYNAPKAAELTFLGLHNLQHRAIDSAGIVSSDGFNPYRKCGQGVARQVFTKAVLDQLHGRDALGHIRYPTVNDKEDRDSAQPIIGYYRNSWFALAHNGNLTNTPRLRETLHEQPMATTLDSEYIARLLTKFGTGDLKEDLALVLNLLRGSFSLGMLFPDQLIAARDPSGNRPLSWGKLGDSYILSSETVALKALRVREFTEIEPGTMVSFSKKGVKVHRFAEAKLKLCRFESIYYSNPSSKTFGESVRRFRVRLGEALEKSSPAPGCDLVIPIPDSSNFIAEGYAASGRSGALSRDIGRSHYVGRTFIEADQVLRDARVIQKFFFDDEVAGKKVVLVDDSIVRLTTLPEIVRRVRDEGAKEVHVRIGSPPVKHPCIYGINTPTYKELVAHENPIDKIREMCGADSLEFLSIEVLRSLSCEPDNYCYACWTGEYPLPQQ